MRRRGSCNLPESYLSVALGQNSDSPHSSKHPIGSYYGFEASPLEAARGSGDNGIVWNILSFWRATN